MNWIRLGKKANTALKVGLERENMGISEKILNTTYSVFAEEKRNIDPTSRFVLVLRGL